jgi:hypothetical protein
VRSGYAQFGPAGTSRGKSAGLKLPARLRSKEKTCGEAQQPVYTKSDRIPASLPYFLCNKGPCGSAFAIARLPYISGESGAEAPWTSRLMPCGKFTHNKGLTFKH